MLPYVGLCVTGPDVTAHCKVSHRHVCLGLKRRRGVVWDDGVCYSSVSVWAKQCEALCLPDDEQRQLNAFIDKLYREMDDGEHTACIIYLLLAVHPPAYGAQLLLTPAALDSCACGTHFFSWAVRSVQERCLPICLATSNVRYCVLKPTVRCSASVS